ncbi:EF-hand domain-containing protein [Rhodovulum adriaticum]|uniref:EF hand domain-containing protein n=1 Tax=Rhodovulum adriaticum TaxID=35804 RepID=A0A4R2NIQ0_RHOAD|nr:EF-hand domain-containing protein [Rhodovulum adriaticum]MBK1635868.1 hypothetical protein [Rhodovulum adriaticum]TCP21409.1 EF hand domain-containing protein [Rhodovulum adriaticum]
MTRMRKGLAMTAMAAGAAAVFVAGTVGTASAWGFDRAAGMFSQMDADEDGKLSLEEFSARAKARFEGLDKDGDGFLTKEEAAELRPQGRRWDGPRGGHGRGGPGMMPYGQQMGPGMQGGQQMGPGYGAFGGMQGTGPMGSGGFGDPTLTPEQRAERAGQLVELLDADGDGKLSAEEMASRPGPEMIFNRVDADGDGAISKEEFDAAIEKFGGRFGPRGMMR